MKPARLLLLALLLLASCSIFDPARIDQASASNTAPIIHDELFDTKLNQLKDKTIPVTVETWTREQTHYKTQGDRLSISPDKHPIHRITLDGVQDPAKATLRLDTPSIEGALQAYVIDPTDISFTNGSAVVTAKGNTLYKCPTWDYDTQTCPVVCTDTNSSTNDTCTHWQYYGDIQPGQNYTIALSPDDPGFIELNISQATNEQNTTNTIFTNLTTARFNTNNDQWLLLGYGEVRGSSDADDVRIRLVRDNGTTTVVGRQAFQPDTVPGTFPPGDYQPFFTAQLRTLASENRKLTMQFASESVAQTTSVRRARAIALDVEEDDGVRSTLSTGTLESITPADTWVTNNSLTFTPSFTRNYLILGYAQVRPESTTESVGARLLQNGAPIARVFMEGETTTDEELFATHRLITAPGGVQQNFTLQFFSETTAGKTHRRARILAIPTDIAYTNESNTVSTSTAPGRQNKVNLSFTTTRSTTETIILGSADISLGSAFNGDFIIAELTLDGTPIGNMTLGLSDATGNVSFIVAAQENLSAGTHRAELDYDMLEGVGPNTLEIRNARITAIAPNEPPVANNVQLTSEFGFNTTTEDLIVTSTISDNDGDPTTTINDWRVNGTSITVLHMPFEGTDGIESSFAKDYSTFGNNATFINATYLPTGGHDNNGAYDFNNTTAITIPNSASLNLTNPLTLESRVNIDTYSNFDTIIDKPTATVGDPFIMYALTLGDNNNFGMRLTSGGTDTFCASAANTASTDNWHHVVGRWNGTHIQLFVNGTASGSPCAFSGPIDTNNENLSLGVYVRDNTFNFDGQIDEIHIYNRSLSDEQILSFFTSNSDLASEETSIGDTWTVCQTPNDGIEDGTEVCDSLLVQAGLQVNVSAQDTYTHGQQADILINTTDGQNTPVTANVTTDIIYGNQSTPFGTPWWNLSYPQRIPLTITNNQAGDLINFIVNITFDTETLITDGDLQANCADIRFARISNEQHQKLSYLVDPGTCNTNETNIWVLLPLLSGNANSTLFLYYDNSTVGSESTENIFNQTSSVTQYVLNSVLAGEPLNVISYTDNNTISTGSNSFVLNRGDTGTFTAAQISTSTVITGTGPFTAAINDTTTGNAQNGDALAPLAFAGEAFTYRNDRGNPDFPIVAPFDDASVQVYDGATLVLNTTLTQGTVTELTGFSITVGNAAIVESDTPVVAKYVDGSTNNRDMFSMYPAGTDWWGVPSNNLQIGALQDNTSVTRLGSDGTNITTTLDRGDGLEVNGLGTEGTAPAYRIISDKPVNVHQIADSDGTESTTFLPETELATEYFLPVSAQYIAVATTQPSTNCTVFEPDGTNTTLTSTTNSRPFPNKIVFGTTTDTVNFNPGTRLACDEPVYAYIEFLNTGQVGAETNIFNIKASRQITSPSPTSTEFAQEQFILRDINATNSSGLYTLVYDTTGTPIGNYTAATHANKNGLFAIGSDSYELIRDNFPPNVTDLRPIANTSFNVSQTIEIAANVTDNVAVDTVTATITFPTGAFTTLTLTPATGDKYNASFTIPGALGTYNVNFTANDTNGLINNTETTFFVGADNENPQVFDERPIAGSTFNVSETIEISANVTDNLAVDTVTANITYPNGTIATITLTQANPPIETGTVNTNGWTTVQTNHYDNPIVVAKPRQGAETSPDNEVATAIITNITNTSFRIQLRNESSAIPGTASYLIAENGTHQLNNGMLVQAGRLNNVATYDANGEDPTNWYNATFPTPYASAPAVIASPNTDNAQDWVTVRYDSGTLTTTGVSLSLEIDQTYGAAPIAATGVGNGQNNSIGWIAINRTSATNMEGALEASVDEDPDAGDFRTLTFTPAFSTPPAFFAIGEEATGPDPTTIGIANLTNTTVQIRLTEERTDGEQAHASEDVSWAAIQKNLNQNFSTYNASFTIPALPGLYLVNFFANDTLNNINNTETTNFTALDAVAPTVTFDQFIAFINQTSNTTTLNETNLRIIDTFRVFYNITDNVAVDRIRLFFRNTNGSILDSCQGIFNSSTGTTGNRQYISCFEWLEFDNTTDTESLTRDLLLGEGVILTTAGPDRFRWEIEDFYKPIVKNYPFDEPTAHFNESFKIFGNNSWRIFLPREVPVDATIYEFTGRFNYTENVTQPIQAYMCNRFFPDGDPVTASGNCTFLDQLTPDDVGGGENFDFFSSNVTLPVVGGSLINASVIMIQPDETNPANYYYPQVANVFNASIQNITSFSDDQHITQNFTFPLSSTSELHWLYEATTCFQFYAVVNDTSGNEFNTTIEEFCWQDFGANFPPGDPDILTPTANQIVSGPFNITWNNGIDPDGNDFNISIFLYNTDGTLNQTISTNITATPGATQQFEWNTTTVPDGPYRLNITATDSFGASSDGTLTSYNFTVDNTPPVIVPDVCAPQNQNPSVLVSCNATITDATAGIDIVIANVTFPNGTVVQSTVTVNGNSYNFTVNATISNVYTVTWFANDTASDTVNNFATATDTFRVGTPPNVTIIHPLGQSFPDGEVITIIVDATDPDGIANVTGNVTAPNGTVTFIPTGTNDAQFNGDTPSDTFNNDTLGTIWNTAGTFDAGQTCTVEIDGTIPDVARTSLTGTATLLSVSTCGISSELGLEGDFNITIPFAVIGTLGLDSGFAVSLSEKPPFSFGNRQVIFIAGNFTGIGTVIDTYKNEGNGTTLQTRTNLTNITSGLARIQRANNNFTGQLWNGTDFVTVGFTNANITQALHVQLGVFNTAPEFGNLTVTADNITIESPNRTWAHYETTGLAGLYNVTIFANDTFNAINDTERTNFTIFDFNQPPSTPLIVIPTPFGAFRDTFNITWVEVIDDENDTLQFNITLLNPDTSFNATIASNLPNIPFPRRRFEWNTTTVPDGTYHLRVTVYENNTAENKSNFDITNDVFFIDNTPPVIVPDVCAPQNVNPPVLVTCNATITDVTAGIDTVIANVTFPNGTITQPSLTVNGSTYAFTVNATLSGQYDVLWFANDTLDNRATATDTFIEGTNPRVIIIHPLGDTFDESSQVPITANVTDADGIDTVIAEIRIPNATTTNITLGTDLQSDNFDTDTEGTKWNPLDISAPGQTCVADIDGNTTDQMHTAIKGTGTIGFSTCGFTSRRAIDGDFAFNITWTINQNQRGSFMQLLLGETEDPLAPGGVAALRLTNSSTFGRTYQLITNDNGTNTIIDSQPTTDLEGRFRVTRTNNSFAFFLHNGTAFEQFNTTQQLNISRALFLQITTASFTEFGNINISWDNFSISGDNLSFALFNQTNTLGLYNFTIIANDTFGSVNDSEQSNFTIIFVNDPPTEPTIITPAPDTNISGDFNITWLTVTDEENDTLAYNITLLNPDLSFNSTIINDFPDGNVTSFGWDTTTVPDGTYNLRVTVYENETVEGNSNSDTVNGAFIVDNTRPNVTILTPLNGTTFNQNSDVNISITFTDNLAGTASAIATVTIPNGSQSNVTLTFINGTTWAGIYNQTSTQGQYNFSITGTDEAGNINDSEQGFFQIGDEQAPNITILQPAQGNTFLLNETTPISTITTDLNNITQVNITLYRPDGSTVQLNLTNTAYFTDDNTLLLLHFDEESGDPIDSSGTTDNTSASPTGLTQNASGFHNKAINFSSTNGVVNVGDENIFDFNESENFTIEAWVKLGVTGEDQEITGKFNPSNATIPGFELHVHTGGIIEFHLNYANGTADSTHSTTNVLDGEFHHIAGVRDATNQLCHVYVDGVLEDTDFCAAADFSNPWNVTIGNHPDLSEPAFGIIDEVRISNIARSQFNPDYFAMEWTNMTLRGRYNITIDATDAFNNTETASTYFLRVPLDIIDVIDINGTFHSFNSTVLTNSSGILDVSVDIAYPRFENFTLANHDENSPYSILRVDTSLSSNDSLFNRYAFDPTGINGDNITLNANASGSQLLKCGDYNFSGQNCNANYSFALNTTKDALFTFSFNATDPGFLETSAAADVALAPIDNSTFIIAFVDLTDNDISFQVLDTDGTIILNTTDADTTADSVSRVNIDKINKTHFVIGWIDGPSDDATFAIYNINGTLVTGPTDVETSVGTTNDVWVTELGDRFAFCYVDDQERDPDFFIFDNDGNQLVGETAPDNNIGPDLPLQNLIGCSAVNSTRWTYAWFDDQAVDDITYRTIAEDGSFITGNIDIDTDAGGDAQVATAAINQNATAIVWYDSDDNDITYAIVSPAGATLAGPTDIDTNAGTESRVAAATIRENETTTEDLFVSAWWDSADSIIEANVVRSNGTEFTAPFTVTTAPNASFPLIHVTSRDPITSNTICPGRFLVAFSNETGQGEFLGFYANGTPWDGICRLVDLLPLDIDFNNTFPGENETITINATILNNGSVPVSNTLVQFFDGQCGVGTQINGNVTIPLLAGKSNMTVSVNYTASPVGPHNISVCVDPLNTIDETNELNNNRTELLNVSAYEQFYGTLSGNLTLDTDTNDTQYDWSAISNGNVYFADVNSNVSFDSLQALGRTTTGTTASNDFSDADTNLGMTGFNDSIQVLWGINASHPKATRTFISFETTIQNVPVINSSGKNNSFVTGILWDTSDSVNNEYDTVDQEDLVFIGNINRSTNSTQGIVDYFTRIPVLLREYVPATNRVNFYVELQ